MFSGCSRRVRAHFCRTLRENQSAAIVCLCTRRIVLRNQGIFDLAPHTYLTTGGSRRRGQACGRWEINVRVVPQDRRSISRSIFDRRCPPCGTCASAVTVLVLRRQGTRVRVASSSNRDREAPFPIELD